MCRIAGLGVQSGGSDLKIITLPPQFLVDERLAHRTPHSISKADEEQAASRGWSFALAIAHSHEVEQSELQVDRAMVLLEAAIRLQLFEQGLGHKSGNQGFCRSAGRFGGHGVPIASAGNSVNGLIRSFCQAEPASIP